MDILDELGTLDLIKLQMGKSRTARLAVAFWGEGAAERLGIDKRGGPVEIVCNLSHGGTNPKEIRALCALPHVGSKRVLQNDRLHTKVYLFDEMAIVGSSNASANGLSLEGEELNGWLEANAVVTDSAALVSLRKMLDDRLRGRPITELDMQRAEEAWRARRHGARLAMARRASLLDALIDDPKTAFEEDIYFAAYDEDLSDKGRKEQKEVRTQYGPDFGVFEDWPDIPREVPIVCFWIGAKGVPIPDGIWKVARKKNDRGGGSYQICQRLSKASVFDVDQKDRRWRNIWDWLRTTKKWANRDGGISLPISEIANAIANGHVRFPTPT